MSERRWQASVTRAFVGMLRRDPKLCDILQDDRTALAALVRLHGRSLHRELIRQRQRRDAQHRAGTNIPHIRALYRARTR